MRTLELSPVRESGMKTLELSPARWHALVTTEFMRSALCTLPKFDRPPTWVFMGQQIKVVRRLPGIQWLVDHWRAEWDNAQYDMERSLWQKT